MNRCVVEGNHAAGDAVVEENPGGDEAAAKNPRVGGSVLPTFTEVMSRFREGRDGKGRAFRLPSMHRRSRPRSAILVTDTTEQVCECSLDDPLLGVLGQDMPKALHQFRDGRIAVFERYAHAWGHKLHHHFTVP